MCIIVGYMETWHLRRPLPRSRVISAVTVARFPSAKTLATAILPLSMPSLW